MRRLSVEHRTTYVYDDVVNESYGRAHLLAREEPGQRVVSSRVTVTPGPEETHEHVDYHGNRSSYFRVSDPHRELSVTSLSLVEVSRPPLPWSVLDDAVGDVAALEREHLISSPMVPSAREVAAYAAPSFPAGGPRGAGIADLLARIKRDFAYAAGTTTVNTPLVDVLKERTGVCQDFAHLAIACFRSVGLPAMYVSGYLETTPPPGKPRLIGVDASHAWASVHLPGVGWVDVDPTNNQAVDDRYVVVARGRDYGDVPPLKGVIFTKSTSSTMRVAVTVSAA